MAGARNAAVGSSTANDERRQRVTVNSQNLLEFGERETIDTPRIKESDREGTRSSH